MKTEEYISSLRIKGIIVSVQDERVRVVAPKGAIIPEILQELKHRKQEVLSFFEAIKLTKESVKSSVDDQLILSVSNDQIENTIYEKGQYEVINIQAWRYLEHKSGNYNKMQTLLHQKLDNIDEKTIVRAVDTLVERHENLRTLFLEKEGVVLQQIYPADRFESNVSLVDISSDEYHDKEEHIRTILDQMSNYIFDFKKERAFKCSLIKYEEDKYYFAFVIDHIIYDDHSMEIIKNELFTLCECYRKGLSNPLLPLSIQFKEYVKFYNQHYKGDKLAFHQSYYRNLFKEIPEKIKIVPRNTIQMPIAENQNLDMTSDLPRMCTDGGGYIFTISEEITNQLQKFISESEISLFICLLTSYSIFLSRISNQNDFVIDSPVTTRNNESFLKIVGWLTGTLVYRVKVKSNLTFRELLFKDINLIMEAMDHIYYRTYASDLDMKWEELVSIQLNLINNFDTAREPLSDQNSYHFDVERSIFDINFCFEVYKNGIKVICVYNKGVIHKSHISEICDEYVNVLKNALSNPDTKIAHWKNVNLPLQNKIQ